LLYLIANTVGKETISYAYQVTNSTAVFQNGLYSSLDFKNECCMLISLGRSYFGFILIHSSLVRIIVWALCHKPAQVDWVLKVLCNM